VVKGGSRGWIFGKTFPTRWKAKLAISVFQRGGRASDYWSEARERRQSRPGGPPLLKAKLRKARSRLIADRKDPEAHFDLAVALLARSVPGVANPDSSFYDKVMPFPSGSQDLESPKEHLLLSLALRPFNSKTSAKARYILLSIEAFRISTAHSAAEVSVADEPFFHSLAREALEDIRVHLRRRGAPHFLDSVDPLEL